VISLEDPSESPEPEPDWEKPSRAVIVYTDRKDGLVLWYVGPHVEMQIDAIGSRDIEDLGFELTDPQADFPLGLSVWEGTTTGGRRTYEGDYDDVYLTGTCRPLTDEEWAAIREGKNPWNPNDWVKAR